MRADARTEAALRELQQYAAGPAADAFVNEVVLRLQGGEPEFINAELARVGSMLLEAVLEGRPAASQTLARGFVFASMDLIRTRLAIIGRAGTA